MRLPRTTHVLAGLGLTSAGLLITPVAAFGAWSVEGDTTARAGAAELPGAGTPAVRSGAAKSGLMISWPERTIADGVPVGGYRLTRIDAGTGRTAAPGGTCDGVVSATSCTDTDIPDGDWAYQVRTVFGAHWIGPWGPQSAPILVNTTPTKVAVTFPVTGTAYSPAQFDNGCPVAGFCGTVKPAAGTSVTEVRVALQRGKKFWNPGTREFDSDDARLLAVTLSGLSWRAAFPAAGFDNGNHDYSLRVVVADSAGGTITTTLPFSVKQVGKPVRPAPAPVAAKVPESTMTPVPAKPAPVMPVPAEPAPGTPAPAEPAPGTPSEPAPTTSTAPETQPGAQPESEAGSGPDQATAAAGA